MWSESAQTVLARALGVIMAPLATLQAWNRR